MRYAAKLTVLFIAVLLFLVHPTPSYADHHEHHDDHFRFGLHLSLWPDPYYYERDYFVPPSVVTVIPSEFQPVIINGITYYYDNGVYYLYTRNGYQVVPAPDGVVQPAPIVINQAPVAATAQPPAVSSSAQPNVASVSPDQEDISVNIPNDKGGYTAVVIKRTKNGFVGPQGEFYSEFPKVSQLKVMYGK